ncbi:hypothetical protein [Staphylococcus xylosus]|uniref:hypothetical protein n=1 Tax=Staphylococcus xylosus TaxID=1288 RepID=UPI002DB7447A|nr:hypothetical protein [Staphylococcus xylosus]MEB8099180.1 hypothetical protein [Staphylococcus xylosus]MEB8101035.1 hypothetical protein [Staphylococcus xylosus]
MNWNVQTMKDREYKDAWQELKEEKIRYFILLNDAYKVHQLERQRIPLNVTRQTLLQMDKLDNTNEFSNLLSDLEDE